MGKTVRVYVGTYTMPILFGTGKILNGKGKGIHLYELDLETGRIVATGLVPQVDNPSYITISPDRKTLFCVNELKHADKRSGGRVSAFQIDCDALRFLGSEPTDGADPCHVTVDAEGKYLFTANFMSGSLSMHPIEPDGALGLMVDFRQHEGSSVNLARQSGPHAHASSLSADNRFVFVPDLGLDKVMVYELDSAHDRLIDRPDLTVTTVAGAGPRHIVFHPSGHWAYLINELDSTIASFSYDAASGKLSPIGVVSTLPLDFEGASTCAHILMSPCGGFVYGSNRGHDSIAAFRVQEDGSLESIGCFSTQGQSPRHFTIDPTGAFLLVANQDSDQIVVFPRDQATGVLLDELMRVDAPTPVCVTIYAGDCL